MSEATFKSIILEKKRQVFESRKANAFEVVITQKLTSSLAQVAVKTESKPMKIPLIVFGAGMFGKDAVNLKGHRCGVQWYLDIRDWWVGPKVSLILKVS
ncbi:hypothetical protein HMPREF1544_05465 [Mucor circinelloides 1006PhL]|uniref:Uncharacterized protein n=1 Tax=Mucor circinelloides f. circinelloides (strain 1006PhL) TaxID=1220926 RepID=S2JCZ2_MUCC1|nr:hypothetical protein HMPREF1544_05465 [Mucor circinelloides 1006PhL]